MKEFSYKTARSAGLIIGIGIVLTVETFALHVLLVGKHPIVAWTLTASSISLMAWLIADYRAMGVRTVKVTDREIDITIGRRARVSLARDEVISAIRPAIGDLPRPGASEFVNLTKHANPNLLLTLRSPTPVSIGGFIKQPARWIALHLDEPEAFLAALRAS